MRGIPQRPSSLSMCKTRRPIRKCHHMVAGLKWQHTWLYSIHIEVAHATSIAIYTCTRTQSKHWRNNQGSLFFCFFFFVGIIYVFSTLGGTLRGQKKVLWDPPIRNLSLKLWQMTTCDGIATLGVVPTVLSAIKVAFANWLLNYTC